MLATNVAVQKTNAWEKPLVGICIERTTPPVVAETSSSGLYVETSSSGLYVAPGNRRQEGGGANDYGFGDTAYGTENTLYVSNLTKSVTEDDLRELFERFGRIHRVSIPRNDLKEPRGFAYIAFAKKEDAEVALARLDGHGYDHLIIKVEWAKVIIITILHF